MRKPGMHEKPGEIKKSIFEYLLTQKNGIDEPTLRDFIKKKHQISENKTIKNHLKDLLNGGCVSKIETAGYANHWIIDNIIQLKNFYEKYDIFLYIIPNSERAITIILDAWHINKNNTEQYATLKHGIGSSTCFLKLCLDYNFDDFYNRCRDFYKIKHSDELNELVKKIDKKTKALPGNIIKEDKIFDELFKENVISEIIDHCILHDVLNGNPHKNISFIINQT